jgi:hypothetical protein
MMTDAVLFILETPIRPTLISQQAAVSPSMTQRAAFDPRQEPGAVVPHAGICAGGAGQPASLPRLLLAR